MDCAEDLSWIVFFYQGSAAAAGQAYSGAIIASATGEWPENKESYMPRIEKCLDECGIKIWEFFEVDNCNCEGAPLELSDEIVMKS